MSKGLDYLSGANTLEQQIFACRYFLGNSRNVDAREYYHDTVETPLTRNSQKVSAR